mmetsp:Transcript_16526/g.42586  ORF Transcript_16526/g.42586 Transcript_16526/m.42586 type:complete len:86 (-) Transcript_16526:226-483(-)
MVPPELWTSAWKTQHPDDLNLQFPLLEELENHPDVSELRDSSLCLPVIAPTKRGRPRSGRLKSSMKKTIAQNEARKGQGRVCGGH